MLNKKLTISTLFTTIVLMSFLSIGRTTLGPLNVKGEENQLSLNTVSLDIHQSFGQPAQNITNFYELLIAVDDDITRSFAYDVSTSRVGSRGANWFRLFTNNSDGNNIFETYVDEDFPLPGSNLNKWILTNVTMKVALYAPTDDPVTINLVTKGNGSNSTYLFEEFEPTLNTVNVTNFNTSNVTLSQNFGFDLGINQFSIVPSQDIYFTEFTLTYSINYSDC
jgi:hypothetical protein